MRSITQCHIKLHLKNEMDSDERNRSHSGTYLEVEINWEEAMKNYTCFDEDSLQEYNEYGNISVLFMILIKA